MASDTGFRAPSDRKRPRFTIFQDPPAENNQPIEPPNDDPPPALAPESPGDDPFATPPVQPPLNPTVTVLPEPAVTDIHVPADEDQPVRAVPKAYISRLHKARPLDLGQMNDICDYCSARRWVKESISCCLEGEVVLDPIRAPPHSLRRLFEANGPESKHFKDCIRSYNNALTLTSCSFKRDTRIDFSRGVQCFQIHGALYHYQGPLVPRPGETPSFAQLFFYDPQTANSIRLQRYSGLQAHILGELTDLLIQYNPFISLYRTARERLADQQEDFRIVLNPQMRLVLEGGADRRRDNLPTCNEVTAIIPYEREESSRRDIVLAVRNPGQNKPKLTKIHPSNASYMPLHYVLLFPYGDYGWHYGLTLRNRKGNRKSLRLEQLQYYRYRLMVRNSFSALHHAARLFQQYVVDVFAACEETKLEWIREHQKDIRADLYNGLADAMDAEDTDASKLGRRIVLPSSYISGDRFMQQLYYDSMAIASEYRIPHYFLTFTANPKWAEITRELFEGQTAADRPDLVARVFHTKILELLKEIRKGLLGPYRAHVFTIEYQKRGLPHMHLLIWLNVPTLYLTAERIDQLISAELPDRSWDPTGELTDMVIAQMTHGPCGEDNPNAPCMQTLAPDVPAACSKRFPKNFSAQTTLTIDSYPLYRRRNDGRKFSVPKPGHPNETVVRDNRWVVPYSPYLMKRYRSHINLEVCAGIKAIKYVNKYVYKGSDRATVGISGTVDEIEQYVQGRYVGPTEACWRIFGFRTHQEYPPVERLALHIEGEHTVFFPDDLPADELAIRAEKAGSTLTAFFKYNQEHPNEPKYLYKDFPKHFVFDQKEKAWRPRKNKATAIGRVYACTPLQGERFYLRLLLTAVAGPVSFESLYWHQGIRLPTYQQACVSWGLAENDQEWFDCFEEAKVFASGHRLRTVFATGLMQQAIADPPAIWNRFKENFCDDLLHRLGNMPSVFPLPLEDPHLDYGLFLIGKLLADQRKTLTDLSLPENIVDWAEVENVANRDAALARDESLATSMRAQLNSDQSRCFEAIMNAVSNTPETAHFYLQGPGGTGKTFLYKTICHYFRALGKVVLCVASTGIAALLLPGGCTSHSQFRIPLVLNESSVSMITKNSRAADELKRADLIIWDEVPMQNKRAFEVVHRLMVDLHSTKDDVLFGGVPVILGGDFAQILPVVKNGSRADMVLACLQRSWIWPRLRRLRLYVNMRVRSGIGDQSFLEWISQLPYKAELYGSIPIPPFITQYRKIDQLLLDIYPPALLAQSTTDPSVFRGRAVLSTLNTTVTELNRLVLRGFPGQSRVYHCVNSIDTDDSDLQTTDVPVEFLQSIDVASLPPSELVLKRGVPIILLRNLCPREGLCNGTRIAVTNIYKHSIEGRIIGSDFDGQLRLIPRITLTSGENDQLPFTLCRKQFPVRLCFAMTINKSQGQSFETIGLDLRSPVFSHGQFYVAVSRVTSAKGLKVLLPESSDKTANIVYPEVLQDLH